MYLAALGIICGTLRFGIFACVSCTLYFWTLYLWDPSRIEPTSRELQGRSFTKGAPGKYLLGPFQLFLSVVELQEPFIYFRQ